MPVAASSPGILSADGSGAGDALAWNADGTVNGPSNPAAEGSTVAVLITGADPASPSGTYGVTSLAPAPGFVTGVYIGWVRALSAEATGGRQLVSVNPGFGHGTGQYLAIYVH